MTSEPDVIDCRLDSFDKEKTVDGQFFLHNLGVSFDKEKTVDGQFFLHNLGVRVIKSFMEPYDDGTRKLQRKV